MKVISTGFDNYNIMPSATFEVYDKLPAGFYYINFDPMKGFSLSKRNDIKVDEKIYGEHERNLHIITEGFKHSNRNIGVIFSGDKGLGKSLVAKKLCENMKEKEGIPVIIVDQYIPDIVQFIESIDQTVVLFFDEFDKMFSNTKDDDDNFIRPRRSNHSRFISIPKRTTSEQDSMLSLFDGTSSGKKMFVLTCNSIYNLNDCLINRTGRFHYHVRFEYPNRNDIKEYLIENLNNFDNGIIEKVQNFAMLTRLTYDSLRSICFELNLGRKFEEIINLLNIINYEDDLFLASVVLSNGENIKTDCYFEPFGEYDNDEEFSVHLEDKYDSRIGDIIVKYSDIKFDPDREEWFVKDTNILKPNFYREEKYEGVTVVAFSIKRFSINTYKYKNFI